jgi:hypothetical protein
MAQEESSEEQKRRAWAQRVQSFKDRSEEYERAVAATTDEAVRRRLMEEFASYRMAHRSEDVATGRRSEGFSVLMRQVMWVRWLEVAVEHESAAKQSFRKIVADSNSGAHMPEFRDSLVAVTAAAYCIEALYGEIKYLIDPVEVKRPTRSRILARAFQKAFGIETRDYARLEQELAWLFQLRNYVVHAYTEDEPPVQHPAGINTGADASRFNAVTSGRTVDIAMLVLQMAEAPTAMGHRWVERWILSARPYYQAVVQPLRDRRQMDQLELPAAGPAAK